MVRVVAECARALVITNTRVTGAVKLTDFGLAAQLTEKVQQRKTMLGTAEFMAPEILRGESYGCKVGGGECVDVIALRDE
jgi:serine/threonine protein kinase